MRAITNEKNLSFEELMDNKTKKAIGTLAAEAEQVENLLKQFDNMNAKCEETLRNLEALKCKK